jgi:hypothetical protein
MDKMPEFQEISWAASAPESADVKYTTEEQR